MTVPTAFAYRPLSKAERGMSSEAGLSAARLELSKISASVNTARLDDHRRNTKIRLTAKQRRYAKAYGEALKRVAFWQNVVNLKRALVSLYGDDPPEKARSEADGLSKDIIDRIEELSERWRIGGSALLHNVKINLGFREKGFCYHFAAELRKVMAKSSPEWFDSKWGTAWEGDYRENNALVITARGRPFESGIAVDPWRAAGRPFWTAVKGDRFPWVEGLNVENRFDVE
ncbi:MAG TPA: hypothetical protein PLZ86_01870 [bacterium]|nr:hypothetical protein [bacterium]